MTTKDITEQTRDRIRGCLIGGAVGDALGYPVEFLSYSQIIHSFGEKGITEYALDVQEGKAVISDDTQMTLFTAEGLLNSAGKKKEEIPYEVYRSYLNWYQTQRGRRKPEMGKERPGRQSRQRQFPADGNSGIICVQGAGEYLPERAFLRPHGGYGRIHLHEQGLRRHYAGSSGGHLPQAG